MFSTINVACGVAGKALCLAWTLLIFGVDSIQFGPDGSCTLYGFVPFTSYEDYCWLPGCANDGFMHMTSAVMAIEHFNNRSSPVVTNLEELIENCPVYFDNLNFFDTGTRHEGPSALWQQVPSSSRRLGPAIELSTMAATMKFPLIVNRAGALQAVLPDTSPFTTQIYPSAMEACLATARFLKQVGRIEFVSLIYPFSPTGANWRSAMVAALDAFGARHEAFAFDSLTAEDPVLIQYNKTMKQVKDTGYRTIILNMEDPSIEFEHLAEAAASVGLVNPDYIFVIVGNFDSSYVKKQHSVGRKLLEGALWILPTEEVLLESDPFVQGFRTLDPSLVDRLNKLNPIHNQHEIQHVPSFGFSTSLTPGYVQANSDFFEKSAGGSVGSAFMYDAVMTAGIGACRAWRAAVPSTEMTNQSMEILVEALVEGIRSAKFRGASGAVQFGGPPPWMPTTRSPGTTLFDVWNILPETSVTSSTGMIRKVYSTYITDGEPVFRQVATPYYPDGRSQPPDLLRDIPEQNYISKSLRATAFLMFGVAVALCLVTAIWITWNREHRVVKAAQPFFLYGVCLGTFIWTLSIVFLSFDESSGLGEGQLDRMCATVPWLLATGHVVTYGALSAKLWRLNRVLQPIRRRIDLNIIALPSLILMAVTLMLLTAWSIESPMQWTRVELDSDTGESYGSCDTNEHLSFAMPTLILMTIPLLSTGHMAYCTKEVDNEYSESHWIFVMVLVEAESILFYTPTMIAIQDLAPGVQYLGSILVIWSFSMSTIVLIIGPKVYKYYSTNTNGSQPSRRRGPSNGDVYISGLDSSRFDGSGMGSSGFSSRRFSCASLDETNFESTLLFSPVLHRDSSDSAKTTSRHSWKTEQSRSSSQDGFRTGRNVSRNSDDQDKGSRDSEESVFFSKESSAVEYSNSSSHSEGLPNPSLLTFTQIGANPNDLADNLEETIVFSPCSEVDSTTESVEDC